MDPECGQEGDDFRGVPFSNGRAKAEAYLLVELGGRDDNKVVNPKAHGFDGGSDCGAHSREPRHEEVADSRRGALEEGGKEREKRDVNVLLLFLFLQFF